MIRLCDRVDNPLASRFPQGRRSHAQRTPDPAAGVDGGGAGQSGTVGATGQDCPAVGPARSDRAALRRRADKRSGGARAGREPKDGWQMALALRAAPAGRTAGRAAPRGAAHGGGRESGRSRDADARNDAQRRDALEYPHDGQTGGSLVVPPQTPLAGPPASAPPPPTPPTFSPP